MALTLTTLAAAKATNDRTIQPVSAVGAINKHLVLVDGEVMRVTDLTLSPTIGVVPGYNGTTAGPHAAGAPVVFGLAQDFPSVGGPQTLSINANGAITGAGGLGSVPVVDTIVYLVKPTAGAYTIALPTLGQTNTITFISTTAAAHVVTMTGNPAASDIATWAAAAGNSLTIKAVAGAWAIQSGNGVTVA